MPLKVFLTGVTGYIGGSVFSTLRRKHPEYALTVLLRKPPPDFKDRFPDVKLILGDFDSSDIISQAAAETDVAIHNGDGDHKNALNAIIEGLLRRKSPSYLLKLSGTGTLYDYPSTREYIGRFNPKTYSDIDDIDEILALPLSALHHPTDAIVQKAAAENPDKLKTAIVCPSDVYGRGTGPGRTQTYYIPQLVEGIKKIGAPFYLEQGSNIRGWIGIEDLVRIYVALVEAAAAGGGQVTWGKKGFFLASSEEHSQREIAEAAAKFLHSKGLIKGPDTKQISNAEMTALYPSAPDSGFFAFGANSRSKADRARHELTYSPSDPDFLKAFPGDLMDAFDAQK